MASWSAAEAEEAEEAEEAVKREECAKRGLDEMRQQGIERWHGISNGQVKARCKREEEESSEGRRGRACAAHARAPARQRERMRTSQQVTLPANFKGHNDATGQDEVQKHDDGQHEGSLAHAKMRVRGAHCARWRRAAAQTNCFVGDASARARMQADSIASDAARRIHHHQFL